MTSVPSKYFKVVFAGKELRPYSLSKMLKTEPTSSYERGSSLAGRKPRPIGMWSYRQPIEGAFEDELEKFLNIFPMVDFREVENIERASLHIFLGLSDDDSILESSYECLLSPDCIKKISNLGLEVRLTIN